MQWTFVESLQYECQAVSVQQESWKNFCYARVMNTPQSHITVLVSIWIRLDTTSSVANLPTLLHKELYALKKHDLALSKLHFKVQPLLKNTPKYRQQSTQLMAPPETVVSAAQWVFIIYVQTECTVICLH